MEPAAPRHPVMAPIASLPVGHRPPPRLVEPLTPLFGRADDIAALLELLDDEATRLITLSGPPGIGKTRLALAVAREWCLSGRAARFVALSALSDPVLVAAAMAQELGLDADARPNTLERVAALLAEQPTLLVLDNFEQLLDAAPDLVEIMTRAPATRLLVTSRTLLHVRGEREWRVGPLALPATAAGLPLDRLPSNPAVGLLLDRARAANPAFSLTDNNAPAIAALCVRLEGIPLALELAAPWLRLLSAEDLLQRLAQPLSILRGGARDLPPRQRTLVDAIAWSEQLLQPDERRVFHLVPVFVDGWTVEAAEAVCGAALPGLTVLDALSALLDASLVYQAPGSTGKARLRMLEMIREYAQAQLAGDPLAEELRARHADYFRELARRARPNLFQAEQARWLDVLEDELGNLRGALRWLIDRGEREHALRLTADLDNFWLIHDHLDEGTRWLQAALDADGSSAPETDAAARRVLATLTLRRGDYALAESLYSVNLVFARERRDHAMTAQTLLDLGTLHFVSEDLPAAVENFRRAVELGQAIGDRRTVARALNQLGEVARYTGDDRAAATRYHASLTIWRELDEKERIAMVLHNLGPVLARSGDRDDARALLRESLVLSRELRHRHGIAISLYVTAGVVSENWSDAAVAARLLGAAEAFRRSIGVQWEPVDQAEYGRSAVAVRALLDDIAFEHAFEEGRQLSLDQATEIALRLLAPEHGAGRRRRRQNATGGRPAGGLTRREFEIAQHVALGQTNKEIADALSIAEKTVEMHVGNSLGKLGLRSRAQLAAWVASRADSAD